MIRRYRAIIFLLLLTFLVFFPFFRRGYIPMPASFMVAWYEPFKSITAIGNALGIAHKPVVDDAFRHLYPLRVLAAELLARGQLPLWNPYNAAGTPLLAIMHPGYLTPFGIFFLFLDPRIAWLLYIMLQPIVLGLATYWYGRVLKLSARASLFATAILTLSGFAVARLEYGEFLYILAGLPVLLGIVEILKRNASHPARFLIPVVVALLFLSGQPHMTVYVIATFVLYALVRLPWQAALRAGAWSLPGVGMAAIQLLPSLELFTLATISRQTSAFIFDRFLLPFSHVVTILIPNYFGNQATYNYFGPHDYVETIAYVGTIPFLFTLAAFFGERKRRSIVLFYSFLAVLVVLTTLRWVGAELLFRLPIPVLSADVPSRVFVLSTFALAILAGIGFDRWEARARVFTRPLLLLWGGVAVILAVTVAAYTGHLPCPSVLVAQCRLVSLRTTLIETGVLGIASLVTLLLPRISRKNIADIARWVPVALVVAVGAYNAYKFLPFSPAGMIFPEVPVLTALKSATGDGRAFGVGRAQFKTNILTAYRIATPEYFDPLHVARFAQVVSFANTGDPTAGLTRSDVLVVGDATPSADVAARRERFLDLTSVSHTVFAKDERPMVPNTHPVWEDGTWYITKRPSPLPRMYFVNTVEVAAGDRELLTRLFDPAFDPHASVLLEGQPHDAPSPKSQAEIVVSQYDEQSVFAHVQTDATAVLVLADTWYPGWKARIDHEEVPMYRANYAFRAVIVPAGDHEVVFSYEPESVRWGLVISILSGAIWIIIFARRKMSG
jgi:hypothetical protein